MRWPTLYLSVKCVSLCVTKSLQSCPTLCDPIDGSPPGFPVPGILQARTLEWVTISFSLSKSNSYLSKERKKERRTYSFFLLLSQEFLFLGFFVLPPLLMVHGNISSEFLKHIYTNYSLIICDYTCVCVCLQFFNFFKI